MSSMLGPTCTGDPVAKKLPSDDRHKLRTEAEARFSRVPPGAKPQEPNAALLHELQVHQIELEMQNEELRRDHLEIEAANERLVDLYDFAPVGYLTLDEKGVVTDANLTAAGLLGLERERLLGLRFPRLVASKDADRWRQFFSALVRTDEKRACRIALTTRGGADFAAHLTCEPGTGAGSQVRVVLTDFTEVEQVEQALRDSEVKFRAVADHTYDWEKWDDLTGAVLYCSPSCERVTGYPPDAFRSDPDLLERIVHPDDLDRWRAHYAAMHGKEVPGAKARSVEEVEFRILHPDGKAHWIGHVCQLIRDVEGRDLGYRISNRDITGRKQAEQALLISEARFKAIFEEAPLGIALIDSLTGRIHAVNPMFARIVGRTREEMTSIDWMSITHPEDVQQDLDRMARLNAGEIEGFQMEKRYFHRDGSTVWISMTIAKVIVDERTGPRHLCMIEDITGRKKAEEALASANVGLALTSRLAALGTLVAGVAHEINNPLAAALSDQDLALRAVREFQDRLRGSGVLDRGTEVHQLDAVVEELVEAQEAGRRIERIVKDLKVFGRPNQMNERARIRLIDVVDLAMRWLPVAIIHTATVTVENEGAPDVVATAGQITQVVVNLVTNAAKAAPEGARAAIVIRLGPGTQGTARLEVIDHGSGIEPAVLAHIFEPFFTTSDVGKGTGLGLSICHAIVTAHGGTLTVESEVGKGSTFRVELPAAPPSP